MLPTAITAAFWKSRTRYPSDPRDLTTSLDSDKVLSFTRNHMFFSDTEKITLSAVRRIVKNVGKENIAGVTNDAHVVLDVQGALEVVAPVSSLVAVRRQDGIVEEYLQAVKIGAEAVKDDDVGGDDEEVPRERRGGEVRRLTGYHL